MVKFIMLFIHNLYSYYAVLVGDREVSAIGRGLCVLLGISRTDTQKEAEWM